MKQLSYIVFEENGYQMVGFNKHKTPGFIDDGSGWSDEEREQFEDEVVSPLSLMEVGSFTYEFMTDLNELEAKLAKMKIPKMEPAWQGTRDNYD